ncbi:MAG: hypothetical protein ISQ06_16090 [Planctomycetaceae bacterium]|nr:hypothetical protein [Planctomycetaceae bacterium]
MSVLYDLRSDHDLIRDIRDASLNTELGLKITHGLVGSDEWWDAIERGDIPLQRIDGVVVGTTRGPMGDWPLMKVRSDSGRTTNWPLNGVSTADLIGRAVVVEYVEQEAKKPPFPDYRNELLLRFIVAD